MQHIKIEDANKKDFFTGARVQFVHTANMTLAHWTMAVGAKVPEHSHPHEQVVNMITGEFELTVDNETKRLGPGEVVIIPSHAVHAGSAVTECRIIDVFYPTREDYR
ncbi:MAG: cupin domain-containing protein [Desulfobacterales bacterium]|nr:MAG: cupin domain-containing protein [Desulfobacterales bacterium]